MVKSNREKQNKDKKDSKIDANDNEWISIRANDEIGIPSELKDKYFDNNQGAILKYSNNTDEIGLTPTHIDHENSYSIGAKRRGVQCSNFLNAYNLTTGKSTKHPITVEDGTIWVDTTTTI